MTRISDMVFSHLYDRARRIAPDFGRELERIGLIEIHPPERAGKDILLGKHFPLYTKPDRPIDFLIAEPMRCACITCQSRSRAPYAGASRKSSGASLGRKTRGRNLGTPVATIRACANTSGV